MLSFKSIDRVSNLTRETFSEGYLNPKIPVVITELIDDWPAKKKWTIPFFKKNYGDLLVPVYSSAGSNSGKGYLTYDNKITLEKYLDSIESGKKDYRLFLFNIFKEVPELNKDYGVIDIMDGFLKEYPFTFFGSKGSKVALHYDIDLSHIFLSQIQGRKRIVLFPPEMSKFLYQHPYTVASYIDIDNPDYNKFPALKNVWGYETYIHPGETIFIPSSFWHYIEYTDTGFSMNQRANESYIRRAKGAINIASHFIIDKGLNRFMGENWHQYKTKVAQKRAEEAMSRF